MTKTIRPVFGLTVPCRECAMVGKVTKRDPYTGKSKRIECPVCEGAGLVPPAVADRRRDRDKA